MLTGATQSLSLPVTDFYYTHVRTMQRLVWSRWNPSSLSDCDDDGGNLRQATHQNITGRCRETQRLQQVNEQKNPLTVVRWWCATSYLVHISQT